MSKFPFLCTLGCLITSPAPHLRLIGWWRRHVSRRQISFAKNFTRASGAFTLHLLHQLARNTTAIPTTSKLAGLAPS